MKCYEYHNKTGSECEKMNCRYWIDCKDSQMCCLNLCKKNSSLTLEDVGKIFGITRMRICQIEKMAIKKLKFISEKI